MTAISPTSTTARSPPHLRMSTALLSCVLLVLLSFLFCCHAATVSLQTIESLCPTEPRTLVLSTSSTIQQSHSTFFSFLEERGHVLTFAHLYDDHLVLSSYGDYLYDNLVLFTGNAVDFSDSVGVLDIVHFVDDGKNVILVFDGNVSEPIRLLAHELGISLEDEGTMLIDHFHDQSRWERKEKDGGLHTYITSTQVIQAPTIVGKDVTAPVLFHGVGHTFSIASLSAHARPLYFPIVAAEPTAYSHTPGTPGAVISTPDPAAPLLFLSGYQTPGSARALFCGSTGLFSDAFIGSALSASVGSPLSSSSNLSGNAALVKSVSAWAFRDRGIIRGTCLTHHQPDNFDDINPHSYRINDHTTFSIKIEQYNGDTQSWEPFIADDVQLQFSMIDPYIRMPLTPSSDGTYTASFRIPDVYGVYKFIVEYQRVGFNHLVIAEQVSVTPYRHNQFERFLFVAYPYYVTAFSLMIGFLLFGLVFLYQREESSTGSTTTSFTTTSSTTTTTTPIKPQRTNIS